MGKKTHFDQVYAARKEEIDEDLKNMIRREFCAKYEIGTWTIQNFFGRKPNDKRVILMAKRKCISEDEVLRLLEDFTYSEIENGTKVNGKFVVDNLIKMDKTTGFMDSMFAHGSEQV